MNFFDFLNSINDTKKDLLKEDPQSEKEYVPFMVNRGLSLFQDTIMYANEMNRFAGIPKDWQYDFYLKAVPKRKRFSKWHKKEAETEAIKLIMREYNYSSSKAASVLDLISADKIKSLVQKYSTGGK